MIDFYELRQNTGFLAIKDLIIYKYIANLK